MAKNTSSAVHNVPSDMNRKGRREKQNRLATTHENRMVIWMTCWKWFGSVLKEAGVEVTDKNKEKIDAVIHKYIGEQSSYGRCSANWRKARKEIEANDKMKKELLGKLKALI
jgi:hypothetical protein